VNPFASVNLGLLVLLGLAACQPDGLPSGPEMDAGVQPQAQVDAPNSWVNRISMPTKRRGLVAAAVNGVVYAIGGYVGDMATEPTVATVEAYRPDIVTFTPWTTKAPLPEPLAYSNGAAVIAGKIYVAGGVHFTNNGAVVKKTLYRYDPATNAWTRLADMPRTSSSGVSAAIDGRLYVYAPFGAEDDSYEAALYRYNPSTNAWVKRANPPAAQTGAVVGVINGKMYVAGGFSGKGQPVATLTVYNPVTNTWATKAPMKVARGGAAGRAINGKLYVAGGAIGSSTGSTALTEVYDPATNAWTKRAEMLTPRTSAGSAAVNGRLYVIGGAGGSGRVNEMYQP